MQDTTLRAIPTTPLASSPIVRQMEVASAAQGTLYFQGRGQVHTLLNWLLLNADVAPYNERAPPPEDKGFALSLSVACR